MTPEDLFECQWEGCNGNCSGYDSDHWYSNCQTCMRLYENCICEKD